MLLKLLKMLFVKHQRSYFEFCDWFIIGLLKLILNFGVNYVTNAAEISSFWSSKYCHTTKLD